MKKVYIVSAKRTPIGKFLGSLNGFSPADLGALVIQNVLKESGMDPAHIDEVIVGNILSAGQGQNVGRQAAIKGGIPKETAMPISLPDRHLWCLPAVRNLCRKPDL